MGRGPGLVISGLVLALYGVTRQRHLTTTGFVLLMIGMAGVAGLWLWAGADLS